MTLFTFAKGSLAVSRVSESSQQDFIRQGVRTLLGFELFVDSERV